VKPTNHDRETLCLKCGRCCYHKVRTNTGAVFMTPVPCIHLDLETKLCRMYDHRHQEPWCRDPLENLSNENPVLPTDCPLAQAFGPPDYVGPTELGDNPV
jgi:uncharacterized cysteine cluster protein YcgN (CxxCxxCC family)